MRSIRNSRYFPLAIEALVELAPEIEAVDSNALVTIPTLDNVLDELGTLPVGTLFLGMAEDGLPLLLNLHDSVPGSILIFGDQGAGKTSILKMIAEVITRMFDPRSLQFGVITPDTNEWNGYDRVEHCAGIIPIFENSAVDFIVSLNAWAHANRSRQSVVLLLDGFDKVTNWNNNTLDELRWLLMRGPSRHVWPIVSLNADKLNETQNLVSYFRTYIYGSIKDKQVPNIITNSENEWLDELTPGTQFTMKEGNNWLRFWIPRLE